MMRTINRTGTRLYRVEQRAQRQEHNYTPSGGELRRSPRDDEGLAHHKPHGSIERRSTRRMHRASGRACQGWTGKERVYGNYIDRERTRL